MKTSFKIGHREIGPDLPAYLIAEIGINHEGDVQHCKDLIQAAKESGADSVKLQTIDPDENYVVGTVSHEIFKKAWLTPDQTADIFAYSKKLGVDIFTTAGDFKTLDFIQSLRPCAYKVSSGLLSSTPIVEYILKKTDAPVIISTGMSDMKEIQENLQVVLKSGRKDIVVLHCTSLYPTPKDKVDLRRIAQLDASLPYLVGFSDHSLGTDCSTWSVFSGAKVLERHFSFDKNREGYDHKVSLEPQEFLELSRRVREAEKSYLPSADLKDLIGNKKMYERCLIAGEDIQLGAIFNSTNVKIKRPLPEKRGANPDQYHSVLGKACKKILKKDDPITLDCF